MTDIEQPIFPEIHAEVQEIALKPPPLPELWLVLATLGQSWAVPSGLGRGLYTTREAALKAATGLSSLWLFRRLVRIPGDWQGTTEEDTDTSREWTRRQNP